MQNLASPVESIAIHAHNKALTILDLPTCETQDFASLLLVACVMILSFFALHRNGASPVETQNIASPVEPISTHAGNKTFTILDLPTRETQDFASLLFITCIIILSFLHCIAMASAQ